MDMQASTQKAYDNLYTDMALYEAKAKIDAQYKNSGKGSTTTNSTVQNDTTTSNDTFNGEKYPSHKYPLIQANDSSTWIECSTQYTKVGMILLLLCTFLLF